jgi:pimeloyl-ACP methyl ester carboxylesterase
VTDLAVDVRGDGDTAVLVHGSGVRDWTWSDQLELADRYRLVMPYRRGYGDSPDADPDFEVDGKDVADLLEGPSHLVGFSYGGIGSLLATAKRPELVRTVTVIEPPAFGVALDDPVVQELGAKLEGVFADTQRTPEEFGAAFAEAMGFEARPPSPEMRSVLESFMRERSPAEAVIPYEQLRDVPVLVVSGGWHPAFDAVCEVLADRLGAELATFPGAGHGAQHAPGFNERLLSFWSSAAPRSVDRP